MVFAFQLPLPREGIQLDFSRWMSFLLSEVRPEFTYASWMGKSDKASGADFINGTIVMNVRLAVKNEGDLEWKDYHGKTNLKRKINCFIPEEKRIDDYKYECENIQLFELQSLFYDFYLINLQFTGGLRAEDHFGLLTDVEMVVIHQNGGYTKIWLALKSFFTVVTLFTLLWFFSRVSQLSRSLTLLEKTLIVLAISLTQLNFPLEYLSLWIDFPFNNFLSDLRQGILYCTLFSFWLIFTGEHLLDGVSRQSGFWSYWKQLSAVLTASTCFFIFDSIERGVQGYDPFFSVWQSNSDLASLVLFIAITACLVYFAFLCYHVYLVLGSISSKRNTLPSMSLTRRLMYQGIIYRFKFLLWSTLVCAAFTLAAFMVGQRSQDQWETSDWEWTSAVHSAVYAMCNCYVITLLILYAPSHKESNTDIDHLSEEIEFSRLQPENNRQTTTSKSSVSETTHMKLLQDLASKRAFD